MKPFPCLVIFLFLNIVQQTVWGQAVDENRNLLKSGIYYSYPSDGTAPYMFIRNGNIQIEKRINKPDSIVWKIEWKNDNTYTLEFVSSNMELPKKTLSVLRKNKMIYRVGVTTEDYYTYKGYLNTTNSMQIQSDTIWLTPKVSYSENALFVPVADISQVSTPDFSDTSRYAVLYIYRPWKLSNSLSNHLVFANENIMCVSQNNKGYIFKILREGPLKLSSRLFKEFSDLTIDIRFGKEYYVRSKTDWTIASEKLYNFRLKTEEVDNDIGAKEFKKTNFKFAK